MSAEGMVDVPSTLVRHSVGDNGRQPQAMPGMTVPKERRIHHHDEFDGLCGLLDLRGHVDLGSEDIERAKPRRFHLTGSLHPEYNSLEFALRQ